MKPIVITWGYSQNDGKPYLDCYHEVTDLDDGNSIRMMDLRGKTQGTRLALFKVPKEFKREDMANYIKFSGDEEIKTLRKAQINVNEILRTRYSESNAIDFIVS